MFWSGLATVSFLPSTAFPTGESYVKHPFPQCSAQQPTTLKSSMVFGHERVVLCACVYACVCVCGVYVWGVWSVCVWGVCVGGWGG